MPKAALSDILDFLRRRALAHDTPTDPDLLHRFASEREDAAFSILVERHAPMVMSVCRRILADHHAAEDAFQAVFIVLARRAVTLSPRKSLGAWLHGVAQRIALKARVRIMARRDQERQVVARSESVQDPTWQELRIILDEEIGRLAEKYRVPIVLCHLEEKSQEEAARELGWAKGTVARRLRRGCGLLRRQLLRRGVSLSATALAAALSEKAVGTPVGAMLTLSTVKGALAADPGTALSAGFLSAQARAWAEEALMGMLVPKGKLAVLVLAFGLVIGGATWAGQREKAQPTEGFRAGAQREPSPLAQVDRKAAHDADLHERQRRDLYGDLLPAGASSRLGTLRLRHNDTVWGVAYSSDGNILASVGNDSVVHLWDAKTGADIRHFRLTDGQPARCLAFSPDGQSIAVGGYAGVVQQWDSRTGRLLFEKKVHDETVTGIVFSPDGKQLGSVGGSIVVRDLKNDSEILNFNPPGKRRDAMQGISFSPDGKLLAASHEVNVHVWDVATGKTLLTIPKAYPRTNIFTLFRDSSTLITCEWGCIRVWDVASGKQLREYNPKGKNYVSGLALSPDRKLFALADRDRIHILRSDTGGKIRELSEYFNSHTPGNNQLAFSPDGNFLTATTTQDNAVCVWDISTGKRRLKVSDAHTGRVETAVFSPNGQQALTSDSQGTVRCWDAVTGKQIRCFEPVEDDAQMRHGETVATYSPDGKWVAAGGYDSSPKHSFTGSCRVWDAATGKEIAVRPFPHRVRRLAFSPDGSTLAVATWEIGDRPTSYAVYLWSISKDQELSRSFAKQGFPPSLVFFPKGKSLLCVDSQAIRIWDMAAKRLTVEVPLPVSPIFQAASLSPDRLAVALSEPRGEQVFLTETATGRIQKTLNVPNTHGNISAFSFDGRMLATCQSTIYYPAREYDRSIHLWELATGSEITHFQADPSTVGTLAFAHDGSALVSGMNDGTALIWRMGGNSGRAILSRELEALWNTLEHADAAKAYPAIWAMVSSPKQAIPFLSNRLQPIAPVPKSTIEKLIGHLNSDDFGVRQSATDSLAKMGGQARSPLEAALQQNPTLETRRRLEQILSSFSGVPSPQTLRTIRAIMVLERIGTPDAQAVLATLAKGAPGARETEEAKASLERLRR